MPRKKTQVPQEVPQEEERWVNAKEATQILEKNSGREREEDRIDPSYIRSLARAKKVQVKEIDDRTKVYLRSDVAKIVVVKHGKGDTQAARDAGSRRKKEVKTTEKTLELVG